MSSHKEKGTESSNSNYGLIPQTITTPTPFFGIHSTSCKYITQSFLFLFVCLKLKLTINILRFYVDATPIRQFRNNEKNGVPYPNKQPMKIYSSIWDAEDWATRGGIVKTDWTNAPFIASYRNFNADACVRSSGVSKCNTTGWLTQQLDSANQKRMKWVQKNFMIYNYCTDFKRFPLGLPTECTI